jgi:hypothetical protein
MPRLENRPLETPRSAVALGLVAIVLGVGATMMPPSSWPFLIGLFYLIALATAWLCRSEIRTVYKRLRRSGVAAVIPSDFWFVMICVVVEVAVPTYILIAKPGGEDLRASFQIENAGKNTVRITYIFSNNGKNPVFINRIALYEVVAINKKTDATENVSLCDSITLMQAQIANLNILGPGTQVGGKDFRSSIYYPTELTIKNAPISLSRPFPIDGGKSEILSAIFSLIPEHTTSFDTLVICPVIGTLDEKNISSIAICNGISKTITGNGFIQSISSARFQILPHSNAPTCPLAFP